MLSDVFLNVVMLSVIMLNVVLRNVVAPYYVWLVFTKLIETFLRKKNIHNASFETPFNLFSTFVSYE
jgi:hypothetical protein